VSGLVLGVDLGTTAVKVGASVDGGDCVAAGRAPVPWTATPTGAEVDPHLLLRTVCEALEQACARRPGTPVEAVGVASFAESVVLLDAAGEPLAPLVAWHDSRGDGEADDLGRTVGTEAFARLTGLPVSGLCTAATVRALGTDGLDLARVRTVLSAADWVTWRLSGARGFDRVLAARTGWLDLAAQDWSPELVRWSGVPATALPPVTVSTTGGARVGRVPAGLPEHLAAALPGALVTSVGMDHHVAAHGADAAGPGAVWDSCGTAEAFLRSTDPLGADAVGDAVRRGLTVGWHVDAGHQVVLGALRSGYAFQRVLPLLGVTGADGLRDLETGAEPPDGDLPSVVDPYGAAYHLTGLSSRSTRAHVWAALVAQVAADGAALLAEVDAVAGPHTRVVAGGGWAGSAWFLAAKRRRLAEVTRTPLEEPGAAGAVALAREALSRA
jgi:sugar (pentulose or hexulose) kinase